ncbi:PREDICTED: uncharacterized protein LOC107071410 [Polistes dominula]|uniref:Uncharacterized protein LOC107071410 n=1 Tax=Polistes dominula TaxID=743375 RepID=A0ABM1J093_POLDO|nr:PREDICTED: uncharacterized protein LOC107071410 [Polistes dominula]
MATEDDTTSIGITFEKFNEKTMDFLQWLNTFEQLVTSLNIPDNETVRFLFDWLEPSVFPKIREKISPVNPYELPYDELIAVLTEMFTNVQAKDVADYRFLTRVQLPYESVDEYVLSLWQLSSKCFSIYKTSSYLQNIFMKGLYDQETKEFLKRYTNLSLSNAIAIAKQIELEKKGEIRI